MVAKNRLNMIWSRSTITNVGMLIFHAKIKIVNIKGFEKLTKNMKKSANSKKLLVFGARLKTPGNLLEFMKTNAI